ncbi:MAG TPA: glutamate--tRNA ligase [Alphaproteobacteria bacterium]|nr:glutamate--tRNA ligase [Rhodospirillaceae bacterium]HRJ12478.1 glutamate--tRNA ligase [Alphaproteobacteria bacterium]
MTQVITRFAPSPTGMLHVGSVRTALVCWLFARNQGGKFILRIDDTDLERSKQEYTDAIISDLTWLGLEWDRLEYQSKRTERYDAVIAEMLAKGDLYPCYETPTELDLKRKSLIGQGKPPIYDRAALRMTDGDRAKYEAEGRKPHLRFKMRDSDIHWKDHVRGDVHFAVSQISDPVVVREDGRPLYHLCSVIDDVDFGATHIVRGEDHVTNTACHVHMFMALGAKVPEFAHLSLLADADGGKLSKRVGSSSAGELRDEEGLEPMAILSLLAKLGTSDPIALHKDLGELAKEFDFSKFSRTMAKLDIADMLRLNAQLLHEMDYAIAKSRLDAIGITCSEEFWNIVRANIARLSDVKEWQNIIFGNITPVIANDDREFIVAAREALPAEMNADAWGVWTNALKEKTGRKGKALFMPLRQAITGMDHGPEMAPLLPIIGRDKILERLVA